MEIKVCPSCSGKIQLLKGHRFFCEACDAIFRIHREGPKVETIGALDSLTERVGHIEQQIGAPGPDRSDDPKLAPDGGPPTQGPVDDQEDPDDDEDPDDEDLDEDPGGDVNELWGD